MSLPDKYLIVLLGPTGVGKTELSLKLAKHFNTPIISCDSRQFYREMRIGTAFPTEWELSQAQHYFIGHKSVTERYSCGMFELEALDLLKQIYLSNDFAILVGGSGLYIDALLNGIDDFPTPDPELRKMLQLQLKTEGIESLRHQLKILDPEYYNQVDLKNPQRVLKAVEVCLQTGKTFSSFLTAPKKERPFIPIKIGLTRPREELYERINKRVDQMIEQGLVDEVKQLVGFRNYNALNTVGYKEIFQYLDGEITLDQAIELIKRNTRRYAKRQLTWWARDNEICWFNPDNQTEIIEYIERLCRTKN